MLKRWIIIIIILFYFIFVLIPLDIEQKRLILLLLVSFPTTFSELWFYFILTQNKSPVVAVSRRPAKRRIRRRQPDIGSLDRDEVIPDWRNWRSVERHLLHIHTYWLQHCHHRAEHRPGQHQPNMNMYKSSYYWPHDVVKRAAFASVKSVRPSVRPLVCHTCCIIDREMSLISYSLV